jgi:tripeptide aminopeptidase
MINENRILETFFNLVRLDSPSLQEKPVADHLVALLKNKGYAVQVDRAGEACEGNTGNIVARVPGNKDKAPLAFSAHMDCVAPCIGVDPVLKDGIVRSASETVLGGDDKAGIAAILEAVEHLKEENIDHPDLYLTFTICEESGMHGAKNLDYSLLKAKEIVVLDSGGHIGTVIIKAPAKAGIKVAFTGKAAHAGIEPEKGISAIQMAADAISRMKLLRIDEETVSNLGRIEGGSVTNIVAETATLSIEARSLDNSKLQAQVDHLKECCELAVQKFGGTMDFTYEISYPALDVPEDSPLLERARRACEKLGLEFSPEPSGGGSDANIFSGKGLSCINLGIGMSQVHTTEEYIAVKDMLDAARLSAEIMSDAPSA